MQCSKTHDQAATHLKERQRRHACPRGSKSQRVFNLRQVLHAVIDRRIRPRGRASWPTESTRLPSSVAAMLLVSQEEEGAWEGSVRVIANKVEEFSLNREPFMPAF